MAERDWFSEIATDAVKPSDASPSRDWFHEIATGQPANAEKSAATGISDPNAEPDAPTWLGRRWQDIKGKQDPRYKDVPSYTGSYGARMGASAVTHDDAAYGDILASKLGDRLIRRFKDANGYDLIEYKGDGQDADKTYRAYVNKPGLDRYDISRGLMASVPFVAGAGALGGVTKGVGLLGRAATQGTLAGTTSIMQDVVAGAHGSEQGVSPGRALAFGAIGAGGELAGAAIKPLVDKFLTTPRLFKNGALTAEGEAAARQAGLDPAGLNAKLQEEFAKTYAKTGDAARAGLKASEGEFGISSTIGQRTADKQLLHREEAMRWGYYGDQAKSTIGAFDTAQKRAIDEGARGAVKPTAQAGVDELTGIAPTLAPQRELKPSVIDLGSRIREGVKGALDTAKEGETAAWGKVADIMPKKEAFDLLPQAIDGHLGAMTIDKELTPAAAKMVEQLKSYMSGDLQTVSVGAFGQTPRAATVDEIRRRLGSAIELASTPADQKASKAIYRGYNDWITQAAEKQMLAGDTAAAVNLRQAIDVTREYRDLFTPRGGAPGGRILKDVLDNADTPERVVTRLFGGQPVKSQAPPAGTVDALNRLKSIYEKYGPDPKTSSNPWDDVRLAYWLKLVQDNKGEMLAPTSLVSNIKGALNNQMSVMRALYSPEEMAMMRRYLAAVEKASYRPPNASGSSYGVGNFAKEGLQTLGRAVGLGTGGIGDMVVKTLLKFSGVQEGIGGSIAKRAVQDPVRSAPLGVAHYGASAAAAMGE